MKNGKARRLGTRHSHLILFGVFMIAAAVVAVPVYSVRSSSLPTGSSQARVPSEARARVGQIDSLTTSNPTVFAPWSARFRSLLPVPTSSPETINTFASDCTTPKTSFVLGETVCAVTEFVSENDRFVNWFSSDGLPEYGGPGQQRLLQQIAQSFLYTPTKTGSWKVTIANPSDSSIVPTYFTVDPGTPSGPESIATYQANCTTAADQFTTGNTVCARVTNISSQPRSIYWVNPDDHVVAIDTVSPSNTGAKHVVNQVGKWRVYLVDTNDGSARAVAVFSVSDPQRPTVDLSVVKASGDGTFTAGGFARYTITLKNNGPDTAATVELDEATPNNTTFLSETQDPPSPVFACAPGGTGTVCTTASLAAGATVTFTFVYTVDATVPVGTVIANRVDVSSATEELNPADNTSKLEGTVVSTGGGTSVPCSVACPDDITTPDNSVDQNNNPGAIVHFSPPSGNDECGVITVDHCNDCFFPEGTTTVTATATTGDTCSFTVTVTPSTDRPGITCPPNKTANANADCEATVTLGTPTVTGNNVTVIGFRSDGKPMYDCDVNGENCVRKTTDLPFGAGITTVTWTAYSHDIAGPYQNNADEESHRTGSASCQQTITVNDVTPPVITAVDSTVSADANCQAAVPDYSNSVTDNCSCAASDNSQDCVGQHRITVTQDPAAGTMVGLGPHTIHLTANDGASNPGPDGIPETADDGTGNTTTKDVTFTVEDKTAPTIHCPANMTTNTEPGTCAAHVSPGTATATDNCDTNPTITGTRSDGRPLTDTYPKGTTTITWTATDHASPANQSSCTQTITVEDHENPVIVCPAPIVQGNDPGTCSATVNPGQPTVTDNCDSNPTVTSTRSDGQAMNAPYPKGTTTITWTATDSSGNHSSCTQTVTVVDNEAPTFTFTGTQTMWPPNHKYHTFPMTNFVTGVHDNCDGTIPVSSVVIVKVTSDEIENGNGDGNTLNDIVIAPDCKSVQLRSEREGGGDGRVYTIYFSVVDAAGNVGTATAKGCRAT